MNAGKIIADLMRREGGFADHGADRGGPTKYGITAATLGRWRKLDRAATREEVMALEVSEAIAIYADEYIIGPRLHHIDDEALRGLLVDCGVHSGTKRAVQWLQAALGVAADGVIGPVTLGALARSDPRRVYLQVLALRLRFLGQLITRDAKQAAFAHGWMNRVAEFLDA